MAIRAKIRQTSQVKGRKTTNNEIVAQTVKVSAGGLTLGNGQFILGPRGYIYRKTTNYMKYGLAKIPSLPLNSCINPIVNHF